MNKTIKTILLILLIILVGGAIVGWVMWHKPRRNVAEEKGIEITSVQLVKEFQANETEATKKYINKAMQVTGTIAEMKDSAAITIASDDALAGVYCKLKEKIAPAKAGSAITVKGICEGMMSDVHLGDAVVVK